MIVEALIDMLFGVVDFLIGMLPDFGELPGWAGDFAQLIGQIGHLMPMSIWIAIVANIALWKFGLIIWAGVEWVYKKVPGVD